MVVAGVDDCDSDDMAVSDGVGSLVVGADVYESDDVLVAEGSSRFVVVAATDVCQ